MNYELAKEMKDAGFPQGVGDYICPDSSHTFVIEKGGMSYDPAGCEMVFNPSLSELIEACGNIDIKLQRYPEHRDERKWIALCAGQDAECYATPEIAIARLWLALNQKL